MTQLAGVDPRTEPPEEVAPRIRVIVNGATYEAQVASDRLAIDWLRGDLGLTGTKLGCEIGVCGVCAILIDGRVESACLVPAFMLDGRQVETIEGLGGADGALSPIQQAFIDHGAFQCGICTPGQIMTATALLREDPHPNEAAIRAWMMGALCRCTGYESILAAVSSVAAAEPPA
jgi:aerobic carbon-monoxide dehydrogenase small subunit